MISALVSPLTPRSRAKARSSPMLLEASWASVKPEELNVPPAAALPLRDIARQSAQGTEDQRQSFGKLWLHFTLQAVAN